METDQQPKMLAEHDGTETERIDEMPAIPELATRDPNAPDIEQQDQEFYKFVAAVDELIRKLPVEEPKHPEDDESPLIVATQIFTGYFHHDYKLSAWHQKGGKWNFDIQSVPTSEEHEEELLYKPLWAVPWLRQQIVKMLKGSDLSKQIDEMAAIPEWATRDAPKIEQQEQQPSEENNKLPQPQQQIEKEKEQILDTSFQPFGRNRRLYIDFCEDEGQVAQKRIRLYMTIPFQTNNFYAHLPRILVPQESYEFLDALDGLIGLLPANEPANRATLAKQTATCEDSEDHELILAVFWHHKDGEWVVSILSEPSKTEKKREVRFSLWALPWLRYEMVKMLAEHDGTELVANMPTIPEWATRGAYAEDRPCCSRNAVKPRVTYNYDGRRK